MIEKKIIDKYNIELNKFGKNNRRSIFWTKDKQDMRFNTLLGEKFKSSGFSILDYGCGFCDLKMYLVKNYYLMKYHGCDINENFINIAKKEYDDDIFLISNVYDIRKSYDIILVSGTFNLLCIEDEIEMKNYVFQQLKYLFEKCNYMLTVNFLSHLTDEQYKYPDHFYINPLELYDFAINNLTKRVIINTGSLPYEITVKFFRDESIDKKLAIYNKVS